LLTYAMVAEGLKRDEGKPSQRNAAINREAVIGRRGWLQYGERSMPGLREATRVGKVTTVHMTPLPYASETTARKTQTPSPFDFQRKTAEAVLER
jgi:hypothetical protein